MGPSYRRFWNLRKTDQAMKELLRQSRAWVPVLKSAALFLLPFPLLIAFFVALIGGEIGRLAAISGAISAFFCGKPRRRPTHALRR